MDKRELTAGEKRSIRALVKRHCANYDAEQRECLPLECECYMFGKHFTGAFCRWFEAAVLPLDAALAAGLLGQATKPCKRCGRCFAIQGRRAYCSDACARAAEKTATAARVRNHRTANRPDVTD